MSKDLLREVVVQQTSSVLRVGLAFHPNSSEKEDVVFFFSNQKQYVCSKLVKKHKIVQFEKSCRK